MKAKRFAIIFACLLIAGCLGFVKIEEAEAAATNFNGSASDAYISHYAVDDYDSARLASSGTNLYASSSTLRIGQYYVDVGGYWEEFHIYRGYLLFDTSSIPDGSGISEAVLSFRLSADYSTTDFSVTVQDGQPTYPHNPVVLGDYYYARYSGSEGAVSTAGMNAGSWYNITLSDPTIVDLDGYTKLCLRSSRDISGNAPSGNEYIDIYSGDTPLSKPILYVTYGQNTFTFYGLMDEDTGTYVDLSERAVDVTAYYSGGKASESFSVNGTYNFASDYVPLYFRFDIGTTDREYWVTSGDVNGTIYIFNATLASYTIQFNDLVGILDSYPFVEVKRNVNGSDVTVEKRKVDQTNKVYASLIYGQTYSVVIGDGTNTFSYGDVLFADDSSVELTLRGLEFPDTIQVGYRYVRVYVTRNSDEITLFYEDTLSLTESVVFKVYYQANNSLAYEASASSSNSWIDVWTGADNETDYFAIVTMEHSTFGALDYRQVLPAPLDVVAEPWTLPFLGTLPFPTAYLIPTFIILCSAAAVSAFNSYIGLFVVGCEAVIFAYLEWLPLNVDLLVVFFALMIIFAIVMLKRRSVTY